MNADGKGRGRQRGTTDSNGVSAAGLSLLLFSLRVYPRSSAASLPRSRKEEEMEPRINADERGWEGKGQRTGATDSNSVSAAGLSGAFSVLFPPRGSAFIRGFRSRSCRQ